jgi:hypothetical protein
MAKKKLKPTLPKVEKEILEKGFGGNIAAGTKFVTDGHSVFLASAAPDGMLFTKSERLGLNPVTDASILAVWNPTEKREQIKAQFIGCGKVFVDTVVAVVRDEKNRIASFNPWILKFVLAATQADGFAFGPTDQYCYDAMVLLREGKMVGAIMPMRVFRDDLEAYDLTRPEVSLNGGIRAIS